MSARVHVAVGVIFNALGEILIAQRPQSKHQGGLWEFPGGKVEFGETVQQALARELLEEVGIIVQVCTPLMQIPYDYQDKAVLLDIWKVTQFDNTPKGCEQQPLQWVLPAQLHQFQFPLANQQIVSLLSSI